MYGKLFAFAPAHTSLMKLSCYFFVSSRRRHTRCSRGLEFRRVLFRSRGKREPDAAELEQLRKKVEDSYREQTDVRYAAARLWVDKILDPAETRSALLLALEIATRHDDGRPFKTGVLQV